jgi:hypothetical protein
MNPPTVAAALPAAFASININIPMSLSTTSIQDVSNFEF